MQAHDLGPPVSESAIESHVVPYDPARTRENIGGMIALILIGIMTAIIAAAFALFWLHPDRAPTWSNSFP